MRQIVGPVFLMLTLFSLLTFAQDTQKAQDTQQQAQDAKTVQPTPIPTVEQVMARSAKATAALNDYRGIMYKQERFIDGLGKLEKMYIKFARPFKVYVKFLNRYSGREAIYVAGCNDNEVRVHNGNFPDITVNLDPQGGTAMDGNHHPITIFGLASTVEISERNLQKAIKNGDGEFKVEIGPPYDGRPTWKVTAKMPKGGFYTTAKKGETLWDIAKRTNSDMYLIMYMNKDYDDPDDPDKGDKVFVPNYYCGKTEFIIDRETYLLHKSTTWDWDQKLYETYEYRKMEYNVGLTDKDFDPKNKEYNF